MTALNEYQRLEATGVWRASPDEQRRNVGVSLGDATLTINEKGTVVLTHWSLAAVTRINPGETPALYHPHGDPGETLELDSDQAEMIEAIERVRAAVAKRRPRPGRLRLWITSGVLAGCAALAVLWLPDALMRHTLNVLPTVKRSQISSDLLQELTRVSGPPCTAPDGRRALSILSTRLTGAADRLVVVPGGIVNSAHLPDGRVILNKTLVEDWETPEVPAGFVIAETLRAGAHDATFAVLKDAGLLASLRLLTTGNLPPEALRRHAETLLSTPRPEVATDALLAGFNTAQVSSRPYSYALDVTGETTLNLIESDPMTGKEAPPLLSDANWLRLQTICDG